MFSLKIVITNFRENYENFHSYTFEKLTLWKMFAKSLETSQFFIFKIFFRQHLNFQIPTAWGLNIYLYN